MGRVNTTCGIYRITNRVNGKVYIGSSKAIENRVYAHFWELRRNEHHSITLQRAWDKYGKDSFDVQTVLICSPDMLLTYEQAFVDFYDSACPSKGYNISKDVMRPPVVEYSAERRKQMSLQRLGKQVYKNNPERYAKLLERAALRRGENHHTYGKQMSDETRAKISAAKKGKPSWDRSKTEYKSLKGVQRSEEVKEKIRAAKRSKPCPYAKVTESQVIEIRNLRAETGMSFAKIGKKYQIGPHAVRDIVTGKNWPHVGGIHD